MEPSSRVPSPPGLAIQAVEWLPSGSDAGLLRVRGHWDAPGESDLPALDLRRGADAGRFESLPDARFARDPASWRATYLVPAGLMEPPPGELWLVWGSGARAALPAPAREFQPPAAPGEPPAAPEPPGGEVINRAVLAEHRARRAEAAERAQARRTAEALKAVEVLELRSAELERRLEDLQREAQPAGAGPERATADPPTGEAIAVLAGDEATTRPGDPPGAARDPAIPAPPGTARADALTAAVATVRHLRTRLEDERERLRRSELLRGADAVALAALNGERHRVAEREAALADALTEARRAAELATAQVRAAREQAAEQVAAARRSAAADAAAVRARVAGEVTGLRETADGLRSELEHARAALEHRLGELDAELAAERAGRAATAGRLETTRAALRVAEASARAEAVARAALGSELERERLARAALNETVEAADGARAKLGDDLRLAEEQRDELGGRLAGQEATVRSAQARASALAAAVDAGRRERDALRARVRELERARDAATGDAGSLLARIAELEQFADDDLARRACEHGIPAGRPEALSEAGAEQRAALTAGLDAAAAALRSATPASDPPATIALVSAAPVPPAPAALVPPAPAAPALAAPTVPDTTEGPASAAPPPAAPDTAAPARRIPVVTKAEALARADVVGAAGRRHPWLRGALVKLAHDDPRAAARLLLGLVPAQRAVLDDDTLDYDLTLRGAGTYAVVVRPDRVTVEAIGTPRSRDRAAFHLATDVVTLTGMLAGVPQRLGRWFGPVRVQGRRAPAQAVLAALAGSSLGLIGAARAGAVLEPALVYRCFAYAIHPAWTRGHAFTVAQEITGPEPERWFVRVADGAPVAVQAQIEGEPDAVVAMSRASFDRLLRGESSPPGERPVVRGDRTAVAVLRAWTEQAQGLPG